MSPSSRPPTFYAFLWKLPGDSRAWPEIWLDRELAEREPFRVSEVVEVELMEERQSTESENAP